MFTLLFWNANYRYLPKKVFIGWPPFVSRKRETSSPKGNDRSPESQEVTSLDKRNVVGVLHYIDMVAVFVT